MFLTPLALFAVLTPPSSSDSKLDKYTLEVAVVLTQTAPESGFNLTAPATTDLPLGAVPNDASCNHLFLIQHLLPTLMEASLCILNIPCIVVLLSYDGILVLY